VHWFSYTNAGGQELGTCGMFNQKALDVQESLQQRGPFV
jgi:hypothetical protein